MIALKTLVKGAIGLVFVILLLAVSCPDEDSFQQEKTNTRTQLESSKRQLLLTSTIAELRKHQEVILNPAYFDR